MHIYPKKKVKTSRKRRMNGGVIQQTEDRNNATSSAYIPIEENWKNDSHLNKSTESIPDMKSGS